MAIGMETVENAARTQSDAAVAFPVLSDEAGRLVDALQLRDPGGNPSGGDVARSATVLVRPDGTVAEILAAENYRVRPRVKEVLEAVRRVR